MQGKRGLTRFLLRRLLFAVPTLLGICVVTFALVHLAPGDPLQSNLEGSRPGPGGQALSSTRRLYFLDLPLFYNGSPAGAERRSKKLVQELIRAAPRRLDRAERAVIACGSVCLPALARAWRDAAAGEGERRLRGAVEAMREALPGLAPGQEDLSRWVRAAEADVEPDALRQVAARLGEAGAVDVLAARGSAALAVLLPALLDGEEDRARRAAADAASVIVDNDGRLGRGAAADRETLSFWREWWYQHRRDHVRFTVWERLHGRLTETQFAKWLGRVLTLRLGHSIHDGRPVRDKLAEALPVTLLLSFLAMLLAYAVAVPVGVHAAVRRGRPAERAITFLLFVLYSLPSFWVAMMLILLLGGVGYLDWFPIYGLSSPGLEQAGGWTWFADRAHHLVLPVICLSYGAFALLSRYQRTAMLEVIRQDFIRTARAKGLSERAVIFRHALRNALLPVITLVGLQLPHLISGSVIIERIFNIPGMGLMTFQAFLHRDYPVIMAVSVLAAGLTLLGLILADLLYAVADPRIRLEGQR
jgi:peptide/nickel transport system permease protein